MAQWFDITAQRGQTEQSLMSAWGLEYDAADPYDALYKSAVAAARPYGGRAPYAPGGNWDLFAEMCLRARALYFAEITVGDCGSPYYPQSSSLTRGLVTGVNSAGQIATIGAEIGGLSGISGLASAAGNVLKALPVIGSIVGAFTSIFGIFGAHHAAAVANEKKILCAMTQHMAPYIDQIYLAYDSGGATKAQAVAAMQELASEFKSAVASISKNCNDSCGMVAIMQAHVQFISSLPEVSVVSKIQSAAATSTFLASVPMWAILLIVGLLILVVI